jgi:hypothetical protein
VSWTMPSTQLTLPLPPAQAATTCNEILPIVCLLSGTIVLVDNQFIGSVNDGI